MNRMSMRPRGLAFILISAGLVLTACAPAGSGGPGAAPGAQQPAAKKSIVAALLKPNVPTIRDDGSNRMYELVLGGLGRTDVWNVAYPQLAEAAPTIANGLWKVLADGKMETIWKIRSDAVWQDGAPVIAEDYVFGSIIAQDKNIGEGQAVDGTYASIESITATDAKTVSIKWKESYILADTFPSSYRTGAFQILPRHLLEAAYAENKAGFFNHPYWSKNLIHAGPYQVREWEPDSHVIFEAFDRYVLGRPKIDQIEVKFIGDTNTLVANLLAGAVDMTLGQSISPSQTADLNGMWPSGRGVTSPVFGSSVGIMFQFIDFKPDLIGDVRFRRALTHAYNRQALVDTVLAGQTTIAHAIVGGLHQGVDDAAVKYDFDPRRAAALMEEMGYRKGSDGIYQNAQGTKVGMEVWGLQEEEARVKTTLTSEADWKAFGIDTKLVMLPATGTDDKTLATYPATFTRGIAGGPQSGLFNYFSASRARLPENNYKGGNTPRYINTELDGYINKAMATIARTDREQVTNQAIKHMTDNAIAIGAYYVPYNAAVNNRLVNVTTSSTFAQAWDAHVWDVK